MAEELIPRTPEEDAALVRRVLLNERAMRDRVFADKPALKQSKVAEIDGALKALDALERAVKGGEW